MTQVPTFTDAEVRGMHFRGPEATEYVAAAQVGQQFNLEREPENQYDPHAIKVFTEGGMHLGYIGRDVAQWLAPWMDEGHEFACEITNFTERKNVRYPIVMMTPIEDE